MKLLDIIEVLRTKAAKRIAYGALGVSRAAPKII